MKSVSTAVRGVPVEAHLRSRVAQGRKLLVPYVTGGIGAGWTSYVLACARAGADAIEIGLPFSDPIMDGPTIQEASHRALAGGACTRGILRDLAAIEVDVPLIAMTYHNLVLHDGPREFCAALAAAGVRGLIVPDLPLDEAAELERAAADAGVDLVLLAAPATAPARLAEIAERSRGFVYAVTTMNPTGERAELDPAAARLAAELKSLTDRPVLLGFGISRPAHAAEAARSADGVVIASALMRRILSGATPEALEAALTPYRTAL